MQKKTKAKVIVTAFAKTVYSIFLLVYICMSVAYTRHSYVCLLAIHLFHSKITKAKNSWKPNMDGQRHNMYELATWLKAKQQQFS